MFRRCTDLVLWLAHVQRYTLLPPPTLLLGWMLPVFYTVGGAIFYCVTAPYTTVGADAARFFIRLTARSSTVLSPPTLLLGQMLPVFHTVGCATLFCATAPTLRLGQMLPVFPYGWLRDSLLCYRPYTPVGRPFIVLPPILHLGEMPPVLVRWASACWATLCCATSLHCTWVKCCQFLCDDRRRVGRTFTVLAPTLHLGEMMPVLMQ